VISLRSRLKRLERLGRERSGPCPHCAGRPPQLVCEDSPFGVEAPDEAPSCPACGAAPPCLVLRYVSDFYPAPGAPVAVTSAE
jgi:hypothetical protein